jgi:exoribonuclease R
LIGKIEAQGIPPPHTNMTDMYTLTTKNYRTFTILDKEGVVFERLASPQKLWHCLPGDTIRYDAYGDRWIPVARAKHPLLPGRLELASPTKYGMTSRGNPMYLFLPFRKEYPPFVVGCSERDTLKHRIALVEFDTWPDNSNMPRGNLRRMLGVCGNMEAEREALLLTYSPYKTIKGEELVEDMMDILYEELEMREEVPALTFSIDPAGCRDVDDVISVEILSPDTMNLWITIADVAAFIAPGTPEDIAAKRSSQTTYMKGKAVRPMLPVELSEGICSLLAGQERLGISLVLTFSKGRITGHRFTRSRLVNMYQFVYENFKVMCESYGIPLERFREAVQILGATTSDTHEWVEVCMLAYNKYVAEMLYQNGAGVLRRQAKGEEDLKNEYELILPGLGRLAEKAAEYCRPTDMDVRHATMGIPVYCHASSPIRRYADLVNQRAIHAILSKQADVQVCFEDIYHMNQRSRDLKHYERDLGFLEILDKAVGSRMQAIVVEVKKTEGLVDTWSHKLWVPSWERMITWKTNQAFEKGKNYFFDYYFNTNARFWKDRIVLRPCSI